MAGSCRPQLSETVRAVLVQSFTWAMADIEETRVSGVWRLGRGGIGPFGHLVVSAKGAALVDPPYFSEAKWAYNGLKRV